MYRDVSFYNTSPKILTTFRASIITSWIYLYSVCIQSLLALPNIYDRSPDNNMSVEMKCQEGVTESAASCHLVS